MTTINCSANCNFQVDGKCTFENICVQKNYTPVYDCIYFMSKDVNKK